MIEFYHKKDDNANNISLYDHIFLKYLLNPYSCKFWYILL